MNRTDEQLAEIKQWAQMIIDEVSKDKNKMSLDRIPCFYSKIRGIIKDDESLIGLL